MKIAAMLFLTAMLTILSGCAIEPDDRDFYYRHWTRPSTMDDPQDRAEEREFSRQFWKGN